MNFKFAYLLFILLFCRSMKSQIMLSQNFNSPFNPGASGWFVQNNSNPVGSNSWMQGTGTVFPAYQGAASDYYSVDFSSAGQINPSGISNWLITPTVSLTNGGVFSFATRSRGQYPDRMQILLSQGSGTGAIGSGSTAVGTFTTLIDDINPSLNPGGNNGYPTSWTIYSYTLSGITGTTPGRFAFRYYADNAGPNGANSDYVGVDAVQYVYPCSAPVMVMTPGAASICTGQSATLTASGANSYTWMPGWQSGSVIVVSPTVSANYSVTGLTNGCPDTKTVAVTVSQMPTLSALGSTVCAGIAATLTASGATDFTWAPGSQTTAAIVVTPTANTTYTITGANGACVATITVNAVISNSLGATIMASSVQVCPGNSATLTAFGGTSYSWTPGGLTSPSLVVSPTVSSGYTVAAFSGTCNGSASISIGVLASPSVTGITNPTLICIGSNSAYAWTASGASNYTWTSGLNNYTANPLTFYTPTVAGIYTIALRGTDLNGCLSDSVTVAATVTNCAVGDLKNAIAEDAVKFYPNPFINEIQVSGFTGTLEMFNAMGKRIFIETVTESIFINADKLPKGFYIFRAYDRSGILLRTAKLIKD